MNKIRSTKMAVSDPILTEFRRLSPKVTGGISRAREAAYEEGTVPAKYKLLTALTLSVAIRCEPCIQAYVKLAVDRGASREELIAFLNVAMAMQGCPGEEWAIKAYAFYKKLTLNQLHEETSSCCPSHESFPSLEEGKPIH